MSEETTIPIEKSKDYILSGKAVVIFHNAQTDTTFKYKVRQDKDSDRLWWVNILITDPGTGRPYLVGTIRQQYNSITESSYIFSANKTYQGEIQSFKDVFKAMWERIVAGKWKNAAEANIYKIMHDGTCGRCGRQLTDLESISRGIGPECFKMIQHG